MFKPTQIRSKVTDNPIDLGLFAMFAVNSTKMKTLFRSEFYLDELDRLVYELYVGDNPRWISQVLYEVIQ